MANDRNDPSQPREDLSRRRIIQGAAWSIPVLAAAVATPLAAASVPECEALPTDLVLERVDFRRDAESTWNGELVNPTTNARTGTPVIVADQTGGVGMYARYQLRNASDCPFTGQIRFQIDLPSDLVRGTPRHDGWTSTQSTREPVNGRAYTSYFVTGTAAIAPNSTYAARLLWSLETSPNLAAVWGAPQGPLRWTGSASSEGIMGYRIDYVGSGILVTGAPAGQYVAPDNGTAVVPGRNGRSFFVGTGRAPMPAP